MRELSQKAWLIVLIMNEIRCCSWFSQDVETQYRAAHSSPESETIVTALSSVHQYSCYADYVGH
jgi:hypothetical protein